MTKENDQKLNDEILAKINELVTIYNLNNDESQLKVIKEQRIDSIVTVTCAIHYDAIRSIMTQRRKRDGDFSVGRTTEREIQEVISFGYEFYQSKHDDIKIKTNRKQVKNG